MTFNQKVNKTEVLFNLNIEQAILSTLISNPMLFEEIAVQLKPEDFYIPFHQHLFIVIEELYNNDMPFDEEFVKEKLRKSKQFNQAAFLKILSSGPLARGSMVKYCKKIKEYSEKRILIDKAVKIQKAILEDDDLFKARALLSYTSDITKIELAEIELKLQKNNELKQKIKKLKQMLNDDTITPKERKKIEEKIEDIEQKIDRPTYTSYSDVRKFFKNRLSYKDVKNAKNVIFLYDFVVENEITLVAAKPGTGKTFLSLILAHLFAKNKYILYLDGDNSLTTLKNRKVDNLLKKFDSFDYIKGNRDELNQELNLVLNCDDLSDVVIFVDSGKNLIIGDRDKNKDVSNFFTKLKKLRDKGATIIVLHHTNKQTKAEINKIETYIYAGSSAWEEDSSNVLLMHRNSNRNSLILFTYKGRIGLQADEKFAYEIIETDDFYALQKIEVEYAEETEEFEEIKENILKIINNNKQKLSKNELKKELIKLGVLENNQQLFENFIKLGLNRYWKYIIGKNNAKFVVPIEIEEV